MEKMINHIVNKVHERYNHLDRGDLFQEGYHIYLQAKKRYNPKRAKKSTWIYTLVYYRLLSYCQKETKHNPTDYELPDIPHMDGIAFKETVLDLTPDAKDLILTILEAPYDFIGVTQHMLRKKVAQAMGWSTYKARKVIREIKGVLKEAHA